MDSQPPPASRKAPATFREDCLADFDDGSPLIVLYDPNDPSTSMPYLYLRWIEFVPD